MLNNFANNMISQYFIVCTYSTVPPNIYKFKLMCISGFDYNKNKSLISAFIL